MDTTLVHKQFSAAVSVIQSLPSDGSFKPSHELMLKFYAYYKQATSGPCKLAKPGFWNVVAKAKWDAWSGLGEMSSEDAMQGYISELIKIIERMPRTEEVASMTGVLDEFEQLVSVSGPESAHPQHTTDGQDASDVVSDSHKHRVTSRTSSETDSEDYMETSDTFASSEQNVQTYKKEAADLQGTTPDFSLMNGTAHIPQHNQHESEPVDEADVRSSSTPKNELIPPSDHDVGESLRLTLQNMQEELQRVDRQLQLLEKKISNKEKDKRHTGLNIMKYIPLSELSVPTMLFNIIWPVLVCWLVNRKLTSSHRS